MSSVKILESWIESPKNCMFSLKVLQEFRDNPIQSLIFRTVKDECYLIKYQFYWETGLHTRHFIQLCRRTTVLKKLGDSPSTEISPRINVNCSHSALNILPSMSYEWTRAGICGYGDHKFLPWWSPTLDILSLMVVFPDYLKFILFCRFYFLRGLQVHFS